MNRKRLFISLCLAMSIQSQVFGHPAGLDSVTDSYTRSNMKPQDNSNSIIIN